MRSAGFCRRGIACALLLVCATVRGEDESQLATAKQHFERGKELYRTGKYEEAIREFNQADRVRPSPILIFNIGLALERLGRCKDAILHFERYLREQPDADNRADTEQKIAAQRTKQQ